MALRQADLWLEMSATSIQGVQQVFEIEKRTRRCL